MTCLESLMSFGTDSDESARAATMRSVWNALSKGQPMDLDSLYALPHDDFNVVIEALREWRLQRYVYRSAAVGCHP